ncbi:MAG: hypothetical protein CMJ76_12475 [Planctomycetaceae bacterium]|nr:hypothetical protein [Planctomycetaceae bacterium]
MAEPTSSTNKTPTLSRALGKWSAIAMMVGAVIGSGIFAKPAANAAASNSVTLIMLGWVAGGVITLVTAICMAELCLMMPKAGGTYVYIKQAYGRLPAFLSGWNESVFFQSTANSALAVFFTMTLGTTIGVEFSTLEIILIVVGLQATLTFINCMGVFWGSMIQNLTTVVKVLVLVFISILPFISMFGANETFSLTNFESVPVSEDRSDSVIQMLTLVMLSVMWAYSGGWMVTSVAEEIKQPEKNLSFALIGGALVLMFIYIAVNIAFHGIFSLDEMFAIKNDPLQDIPQAAANAYLYPLSESLAKFGTALISSVIMVSALSALNTGFLTPPRVLFAMARDEMFIPAFKKVHPKTKAPYIAIIGQGVSSISVFLLVTFLVLYTGDEANRNLNKAAEIFDQLTNIAVLSSTVFIVMTIGAVFILRNKEPDTPRPYRIPGYPLVPGIALLMNTVFLVLVLVSEGYAGLFSAVFLTISIPLYFVFNRVTNITE